MVLLQVDIGNTALAAGKVAAVVLIVVKATASNQINNGNTTPHSEVVFCVHQYNKMPSTAEKTINKMGDNSFFSRRL